MRKFSLLAFVLLGSASAGSGCSRNSGDDLSKAKEEAEVARSEAAALRIHLAATKNELEAARAGSDLKQSRNVAEGFLTAITKPSVEQMHGFCTPAEQRRAAQITIPRAKMSWEMDNGAVGANGREATFKGHFDLPSGKQPFVVLVIKFVEAGHDRWLVDAFSVGSERP